MKCIGKKVFLAQGETPILCGKAACTLSTAPLWLVDKIGVATITPRQLEYQH